jgi:hypothetical protein
MGAVMLFARFRFLLPGTQERVRAALRQDFVQHARASAYHSCQRLLEVNQRE